MFRGSLIVQKVLRFFIKAHITSSNATPRINSDFFSKVPEDREYNSSFKGLKN